MIHRVDHVEIDNNDTEVMNDLMVMYEPKNKKVKYERMIIIRIYRSGGSHTNEISGIKSV